MRNKRFLKRILAAVLVLVLGLSMTVQATSTKDKASNTSLSDAQKEMNDLKDQLKDAEKLVDDLKNSKGSVEKKISQLNKSLIEISAHITELENQLIAKNEQLVITQGELVVAKEVAAKQYEDICGLEIAFLYLGDELRDADVDGAALNTLGVLALQAAAGLFDGHFCGVAQSDFLEVAGTDLGILLRHGGLDKRHVSHFQFPP